MGLPLQDAIRRMRQQGFAVVDSTEILAGLTNRLFRLHTDDGQSLILKCYYQDENHRLEREFGAFQYLRAQGLTDIPSTIYRDDAQNYAVYSYAPGKNLPFRHEQIQGLTHSHLDQMVDFIVSLHGLGPSTDNQHFLRALGSSFGIGEYISKIQAVLSDTVAAVPSADAPVAVVRGRLDAITSTLGGSALGPIDPAYRRLSPADFGSHNILVHRGRLTFIDFEEFGWDDPMQLVAYPTSAMKPSDQDYYLAQYLAKTSLPPSRPPAHSCRYAGSPGSPGSFTALPRQWCPSASLRPPIST
jgi:aminoglycoside phosphotransferase (APT) family kinase protein